MEKSRNKRMQDWDRFFRIVQECDPYGHLRSIHNGRVLYDHAQPWVTHVSLQDARHLASLKAGDLRKKYRKPIVFDECRYEGDIPQSWGNLSAHELVHYFWSGTMAGCYVGHGETLKHPEDLLWWAKGGVLRGQSPARIAFLRKIMEPVPFEEFTPGELEPGQLVLSRPAGEYFVYCTSADPVTLELPGKVPFKVDGFDTWEMTTVYQGTARPGKAVLAPPVPRCLFRLQPCAPGEKLRPAAAAGNAPCA